VRVLCGNALFALEAPIFIQSYASHNFSFALARHCATAMRTAMGIKCFCLSVVLIRFAPFQSEAVGESVCVKSADASIPSNSSCSAKTSSTCSSRGRKT
jgi:hypothetical protein